MSIRATRSSKHSLTPWNLNVVRAGRIVGVSGGGQSGSQIGARSRGFESDIKVCEPSQGVPVMSVFSVGASLARVVQTARSGAGGDRKRLWPVALLVDCLNSQISRTRSGCSSAAMTLSPRYPSQASDHILIPREARHPTPPSPEVQRRCRSRRSGDENTTNRHLWNTCTRLYHVRKGSKCGMKNWKTSKRTLSGSAPIVTRGASEIQPTPYSKPSLRAQTMTHTSSSSHISK